MQRASGEERGRMSDDLISRKAVIDYLREQNNNVIMEKHKDGFISQDTFSGMESAISAFRNFILTLTTAFDKGKVIEKLMKYSDDPCTLHECGVKSEYCSACMARKAIEIVEKGGID